MKTICIMNLKGGVGKTVTAGNMAAILAADTGVTGCAVDVCVADHQTADAFGVRSAGVWVIGGRENG